MTNNPIQKKIMIGKKLFSYNIVLCTVWAQNMFIRRIRKIRYYLSKYLRLDKKKMSIVDTNN